MGRRGLSISRLSEARLLAGRLHKHRGTEAQRKALNCDITVQGFPLCLCASVVMQSAREKTSSYSLTIGNRMNAASMKHIPATYQRESPWRYHTTPPKRARL